MIWIGFGFLLGVVLGSFSKALADRSLEEKTFGGRSYCPHCKHTLRWYDLFPIFSYIYLQGRCRYCQTKIPLEYLFIEVIMGILVAYFFSQFLTAGISNSNPYEVALFVLTIILKLVTLIVLIVVTLTDFKKTLIPDRITYPAIIISLGILLISTLVKIADLYTSLAQSPLGKYLLPPYSDYFYRHALITSQDLFGALAMGGIVGLFFLTLILITRGRGMGGGDLKLGIFLGIVFGFPQAILVLMMAFFTGSIAAIFLIIFGKKHFGQTIPFGPFLSLGALIVLFWGNYLMKLLNWT